MTAVPEGSVITTPSQMYEELKELRRSVDRLTTTVDPAMNDIRSDVAHNTRDVADHGTRLTVLETRQRVTHALLYGASGLLLAALSVLAAFLVH